MSFVYRLMHDLILNRLLKVPEFSPFAWPFSASLNGKSEVFHVVYPLPSPSILPFLPVIALSHGVVGEIDVLYGHGMSGKMAREKHLHTRQDRGWTEFGYRLQNTCIGYSFSYRLPKCSAASRKAL